MEALNTIMFRGYRLEQLYEQLNVCCGNCDWIGFTDCEST